MLLRQLKQFTLSAARRNAVFGTDVKQLARFYGSPAVCETLTTTSKVYKRLSKEDRRVLVESYVNEYRASNAGKFPTLKAIRKEVGGSPYILRVILQELKLRPKADVPIVAKALSEVSVSPSVPDGSSSHFSPVVVEPQIQAGTGSLDIEIGSERKQDIIDSSLSDSDGESTLQGNNNITATDDKRETEKSQIIEVEVCLKNSETEEEGNLTHLGNQESKADHLEGATVLVDDESNLQGNKLFNTAIDEKREIETSQRIEVEVCLKNSEAEEEGNLTRFGIQESIANHLEVVTGSAADDGSNLQSNDNLVISATDDKRETETSQRIEVEVSLKNSETEEERNVMHLGNQESIADHLEGVAVTADDESNLQGNNNLVITATDDTIETQTSQRIEVEVCLKNSETEEEGNLTHLGNQESKADHLEVAVSADVVPTETRHVSEIGASETKETGAGEVKEEKSSAWSNLLSFAKDFASIWRR
ncbi:PREDICTED: uncharacterized protein LOC104726387 [Camelina sativa]|uniref:Uncharacterized protein LOC104726387 n=1 Tax=Camelina sativa TaxID=90675 RepID=A0ABM0UN00_CAMSA|nr:PREDICTED: uncharacterized protein LOC104726387 [Camelina sativa]XP_010443536.1 PREDICTED: uncharacterized protein LOC104726387 [Camelina sativa]